MVSNFVFNLAAVLLTALLACIFGNTGMDLAAITWLAGKIVLVFMGWYILDLMEVDLVAAFLPAVAAFTVAAITYGVSTAAHAKAVARRAARRAEEEIAAKMRGKRRKPQMTMVKPSLTAVQRRNLRRPG